MLFFGQHGRLAVHLLYMRSLVSLAVAWQLETKFKCGLNTNHAVPHSSKLANYAVIMRSTFIFLKLLVCYIATMYVLNKMI